MSEERKMTIITPYLGFGCINFNMTYEEVCRLLKDDGVDYTNEHWPNKGCTPEVAWDVIRIGKDISIFFARHRMFKIYFENGFSEKLSNGVRLGMSITEAEAIDPSIEYDDWNEVYTSKQGYWLEDDVESGQIISISIFIKEVENDDTFFSYEWCKTD